MMVGSAEGPAAGAMLHLERVLDSLHEGWDRDARLVEEARRLSSAYTDTRTDTRQIDKDAAASVAYLAHFGPRAIAAVSYAARHAARLPESVVDVGAGSGASALVLAMGGVKKLHLIDESAAALHRARTVLQGTGATLTTEVARLQDARPRGDADGLLCAFAFGELADAPSAAWDALRRLAPKARLGVLVDAGDRPRARRLQQLRDVLAAGDDAAVAVLGPCPHRDPCPALLRERDWCHSRIEKCLPPRLARFAAAVGRDDDKMSLSYLAISWGGADARPTPSVLVIGEPVKDKGRVRVPVCGPGGLRFVQALKRHREVHDALLALPRGTRLVPTVAAHAEHGVAHADATTAISLVSD